MLSLLITFLYDLATHRSQIISLHMIVCMPTTLPLRNHYYLFLMAP